MFMSTLLDVIDEECDKEINSYCELFEKDKGPIQPVAATLRIRRCSHKVDSIVCGCVLYRCRDSEHKHM